MRASQVLSIAALLLIVAFGRASAAQSSRSASLVPKRLTAQARQTHPNYGSLMAGVVLLGFSYAVALSDPVRHGFDDDSRRRAIPVVGPWFPKLTWPWALDGVLQAGGVAFMVNAFVQPVTVLGTPRAQRSRQLGLTWRIDL